MKNATLDLTAEIDRKVELLLRLAKSVEDDALVDSFMEEMLEPLDAVLRLEIESRFGEEWCRFELGRNAQQRIARGGWAID